MSAITDEPAQLLWTGGWDSSFRLLQLLLLERRPVQPLYVLVPDRRSTMNELDAMERMRRGVRARLDDPDLLAPTTVVMAPQFPVQRRHEELREMILRQGWVGYQYVMLAAVAEGLGWRGVEMCIERHTSEPNGVDLAVFDESGHLNGSVESELFRYWTFPVRHLTKEDMESTARDHGFLDLLRERWFCHYPVMGKPCGRCRPCHLAVQADIKFANPAFALTAEFVRTTRARLGALRVA